EEITDHIYGRGNVISRTDRPNLFIKELNIYLDYLKERLTESKISPNQKQKQYLSTFAENLNAGIIYYEELFNNIDSFFGTTRSNILQGLENARNSLLLLKSQIEGLFYEAIK